jgi:signal peptidase I
MTEVVSVPQIAAPAPPRAKAAEGDGILASLQSLLATIVIAVFVITFVVQAFQIPSESMESTLLIGDYLLVDKFCYGQGPFARFLPYRAVQRGDIVVFHYPVTPSQHFVKRVIGVPGDRIRLVNKQVFVNGEKMAEPYAQFVSPVRDLYRDDFPRLDVASMGQERKWAAEMRKLVEDGQLIVPEGNYFVLGDNRDDSQDSRYWGFVPRDNIIGRPLVIYWSLREIADESSMATSPTDRMYRLAYTLTHLWQDTRWRRTFHRVQ